MTRIERRVRRRHQRTRRIFAACAALLAALSFAGMALFPAGADEKPEAAVTDAAPAATPQPAALAWVEPEAVEPAETPAECLAKMLYGEARGCTTTEQAGVLWCALNRVDSDDPYYPDDIVAVTTQEGQFHGYDPDNPVLPELLALAEDVLARWSIEGDCVGGVGRVLPPEYLFFHGDGRHNYFRTEWTGGETWDWKLESPYAK